MENNLKVIPVFFAVDEVYIPFLSVALKSLIDNASKDYHYALEWNDISKNSIEKSYYNFAELDIFHNLIIDFSRSMNGATAYAQADLTRYDHQRIVGKMDPIYDKLGIERRNNGYGGSRDNNFLSNATVSSRTTTIDEMEDLLSD